MSATAYNSGIVQMALHFLRSSARPEERRCVVSKASTRTPSLATQIIDGFRVYAAPVAAQNLYTSNASLLLILAQLVQAQHRSLLEQLADENQESIDFTIAAIQQQLRNGDHRLAVEVFNFICDEKNSDDVRSLAVQGLTGARVPELTDLTRIVIKHLLSSASEQLRFAGLGALTDLPVRVRTEFHAELKGLATEHEPSADIRRAANAVLAYA